MDIPPIKGWKGDTKTMIYIYYQSFNLFPHLQETLHNVIIEHPNELSYTEFSGLSLEEAAQIFGGG